MQHTTASAQRFRRRRVLAFPAISIYIDRCVYPVEKCDGFLLDNEGGKRERNPQFCNVPDGTVVKGATYRAAAC